MKLYALLLCSGLLIQTSIFSMKRMRSHKEILEAAKKTRQTARKVQHAMLEAQKEVLQEMQKPEVEPTVRQEANFEALPSHLKLHIISYLINANFDEYKKYFGGPFGMQAFFAIENHMVRIISMIAGLNRELYGFINHPDNMKEIIKSIDRACYHAHAMGNVCVKKLGNGKIGEKEKQGMPVFSNPQFTAWMREWNEQNENELLLAYTIKNAVESSALDASKIKEAYEIANDLLEKNKKLAVEQKLDVNRRMNDGKTALLAIADVAKPSDNIFVIAKKLLDAGVDVDMLDRYKKPALCNVFMWSFDCRHKIPLIKELLSKGASLTIRDERGKTPLHKAMEMGDSLDNIDQIRNENLRMQFAQRIVSNREIKMLILNHIKNNNILLSDDLKELYDKHTKEILH